MNAALTVTVDYTHHSITSPKADTHFTIPGRVEGWVDLVGRRPVTHVQVVTGADVE